MPETDPAPSAAISDLFARYCWAMDTPDPDALVDCFTVDGVLQIGDREFVGAEGLTALAGSRDAGAPRHHFDNLVVTTTSADSATARAYFTLLSRKGQVVGLGTYRDDLVRDAERGWLWSRKRADFEWRA